MTKLKSRFAKKSITKRLGPKVAGGGWIVTTSAPLQCMRFQLHTLSIVDHFSRAVIAFEPLPSAPGCQDVISVLNSLIEQAPPPREFVLRPMVVDATPKPQLFAEF